MLIQAGAGDNERARRIPFHRIFRGLARNPLRAIEAAGVEAAGSIVQLDLGLFRPYLLTRPEHVQHVLRDHAANYVRDGLMWKPFRRLVGDGIAGDGATWQSRRRFLQPMFSGKHIASILDHMADAIAEAVDELDSRVRTGRPLDVSAEMTRIVHRAVIRVFFGDRISTVDADKVGQAITTAFASLGFRMLLPFVPVSVPVPGDRSFLRAVRTVDEVMFPVVRESRRQGTAGNDVVSLLLGARDANGVGLDDRQVRDDLVAMFVAGSESTAVALTWLWVVLDGYPGVAAKLYDEINSVVGEDRPGRSHLAQLHYTKMVLQELLRLYTVGWIIPRTAVADDVIDGVFIKGGSTVVVSPYLTHRIDGLWPRADVFDPERFAPDRGASRHRFAYLSFGGGPHQCIGSNFFVIEAQLVMSTLLSRYRPTLIGPSPVEPQAVVTLRPKRRVQMILRPIR